ncbi:MAG: HlyD family secretion protein [Geminicoccaceae bacterium]
MAAAPAPGTTPEDRKPRPLGLAAKLLLLLLGIVGLYGLYLLSLEYFAYTSDAFVATDVVQVAPEVGGRITAVHIVDNQHVAAGDPLLDLDPRPYALQLELRRSEYAKAQADAEAARGAVASAEAVLNAARDSLGLAGRTQQRLADVVKQGGTSKLAFDEAQTRSAEAQTKVVAAQAELDQAKQTVEAKLAAIEVAKRAVDLAAYNLEQTHLLAPIAGHVNNMWLRIGDYANPGVPRVGLVADDSWSVIALYREEAIRHLQDGLKVWIYLDLYPYQLFRGTIQGVARGIARGDRQTAILPEIEATTGWIRFQQRFPVRILIDDLPPDVRLHVGANARVLAIYGW